MSDRVFVIDEQEHSRVCNEGTDCTEHRFRSPFKSGFRIGQYVIERIEIVPTARYTNTSGGFLVASSAITIDGVRIGEIEGGIDWSCYFRVSFTETADFNNAFQAIFGTDFKDRASTFERLITEMLSRARVNKPR